MKLELKYLAPYLPHKVKVQTLDEDKHLNIVTLNTAELLLFDVGYYSDFKPILRPMSDILTSYLWDFFDDDIDIRTFLNDEFLGSRGIESYKQINEYKVGGLPYGTCEVLLKYHFDIFSLIDIGLAIDKNILHKIKV